MEEGFIKVTTAPSAVESSFRGLGWGNVLPTEGGLEIMIVEDEKWRRVEDGELPLGLTGCG